MQPHIRTKYRSRLSEHDVCLYFHFTNKGNSMTQQNTMKKLNIVGLNKFHIKHKYISTPSQLLTFNIFEFDWSGNL